MSWVGAPDELTWWQEKAKQNIAKRPAIGSPDFPNAVRNWWLQLQPEWRGSFLSRDTPADHSWFDFQVGGPNGLFLVIVCMSWWLPSVTTETSADFASLAEDIAWTLAQCDDVPNATAAGGRRSRISASAKPAEEAALSRKRKPVTSLKQPAKKIVKRASHR